MSKRLHSETDNTPGPRDAEKGQKHNKNDNLPTIWKGPGLVWKGRGIDTVYTVLEKIYADSTGWIPGAKGL